MNCKEFEQLLYLFREDELSQTEKELVDIHLENCEQCQAEVNAITEMDAQIAQIRDTGQDHPNAGQLTNHIMSGVKREYTKRASAGKRRGANRFQGWLAAPAARYVMATALILIISLFIFQEYFILNKIAALEARLANHHTERVSENFINRSASMNDLSLSTIEMEILEKWVVIRRSSVNELINEIETLEAENMALKRILEERYPELVKMLDGRGLSDRELERLLNSRDELLHALQKL